MVNIFVDTAYSHNIIALDMPNECDWFGGFSQDCCISGAYRGKERYFWGKELLVGRA